MKVMREILVELTSNSAYRKEEQCLFSSLYDKFCAMHINISISFGNLKALHGITSKKHWEFMIYCNQVLSGVPLTWLHFLCV